MKRLARTCIGKGARDNDDCLVWQRRWGDGWKLTRGIDIRPWKTDTIGTIEFSRSLPGIFLEVLESVREMAGERGRGLVRTGNKDSDKGGFGTSAP